MMSYIVYLFMLVSMFLYTYIFGDETSMLMLYMLILSPVLSLLLSYASLKSLEFSIDEKVHASQVEKDGVVGVTVLLQNKSFVPIPIIEYIVCCSAKLDSSGQSQAYCVFGTV